jgi:hypothetical protein
MGGGTSMRIRVTIPRELYEEVKRVSAGKISAWIQEAIREKLERERPRALFDMLPRSAQEKLLGAASGDEQEAARLLSKILDRALEEVGKPAGGDRQPLAPQPRVRPLGGWEEGEEEEEGGEGDWPDEEDEEAFQEAVAAAE